MRLIGVVSEVAADEVAPELVRGVHDDEAASRRVYDKITRPSNGTDELSDETDRLDVGVKFAVDFFRPSVRNAVIARGGFGAQRRLLQHEQIIAAPPRPVAVADAFVVPADLALSRARFIGPDTAQQELFDSLTGFPQAQIGNAPGNFIPEAPWMVASAGITLGERTGWFSTLRWRYIKSRPLTEDGVFQSPPVNTINGRVGYQFANGWRIQLDALNLLNSSSWAASYAYGALLPSDALFASAFRQVALPPCRRRSARTALWTIRSTR